jgi:hypothetical protein
MGGMDGTGERFLDRALGRDPAGMAELLHPRVRLRALQQGAAIMRLGAGAVVDQWSCWFGGWDRITVLDRHDAVVATRLGLGYHVAVSATGDDREVAHRVFLDVVDDQIVAVDLLCSGFLTRAGS